MLTTAVFPDSGIGLVVELRCAFAEDFESIEIIDGAGFRYSMIDTQAQVAAGLTPNDNANNNSWEIGLDYKPIPQIVLKLDYRNETAEQGTRPDLVRIGGGFVF